MELYPLKFKPILKERIWGGKRLNTMFGKDLEGKENIGESWELSAVEDNISVVTNGFLEGNDLQELVEIYMGELVGEKVYEKYGLEFPVLIKLIDANDDLSIQVHPDDETAKERHNSYGKTEMWYALDDTEEPRLITGFSRKTNKEEFLERLNDNSITNLFNYENVSKGDVFFVPAGRVHAICSGNLIAEIQQTSDVTYRIYDYNRLDKEGNGRELHLDLSLDVIDYNKVVNPKIKYENKENEPVELVRCNYFTTNLINLSKPADRDYYSFDSFVILICTKGKCKLDYNSDEQISLKSGETILIPASLNSVKILPENGKVTLLEVYID
jgi:mannose-6-phosphate isomerase